jgi:glucose-1-phosphate cytidylyltransferase
MATYGDGVADIDLQGLLAFHEGAGVRATLTAVRPPARFGGLEFDGDRIAHFNEKPQVGEGWINGGFMVFEPSIVDLIEGDPTVLEREPLETLAAQGS